MTKTIEQLTARVRELETEIDSYPRGDVSAIGCRLSAILDDDQWKEIEPMLLGLAKQLAASQAYAEQLREALIDNFYFLERHSNRWDGVNGKNPNDIAESTRTILATPHSTSALDAYVAEKVKISRDIDEKQIAYLFEERSLLTRQRDLAVEALEITVNSWSEQFERHGHLAPEWAVKCRNALSTIKESEK